ncbi:MAG: inorganic phosphate transporter [Bacteroidales bacterium]
MDTFYLILVIVLFGLAASDLIVGVSNDAVNFLNSAIGSKAASFRVIMIIAALGVLVGATFSSGLMEVARKGIFHPDQFTFAEIMIIFLAVMITDVILLDTFNTFGLPTSTTVSIVFELLGAAVAVATLKIFNTQGPEQMVAYINSGKALAIISGILLSIVIAFSIGAIVQYFARMAFTFNFKSKLKYFGAVWGGLSVTAITYFILIKGAKGSSFIEGENLAWIMNNTGIIILYSLIGWTLIFQLLTWFTRINPLKIIVLIGTFALAMAFAGNDLVNFIGVPLAGYESFKAFINQPGAIPDTYMMTALTKSIKTPTLFLLGAGLIMVVTLWTSRKAKSVIATELNLSRQDEGMERFESTLISRTLVRSTRKVNDAFKYIIPRQVMRQIDKRFQLPEEISSQKPIAKDKATFDLIRASVNLVVASILIAFGTSLKLPLSTTYVTFMVAMGTSLSDRAWGRESAVYRITGVLSVIGGWFLTALSAFTVAFLVAIAIYYGNMIAIVLLIIVAVLLIIRTHYMHRKREKEKIRKETYGTSEGSINGENVISRSADTVIDILQEIPGILEDVFHGLREEDMKTLKKALKQGTEIRKKTKYLKNNIHKTIEKMEEGSIDTGHFYVQVVDYLKEISNCIYHITVSSYQHIDNNHKGFLKIQLDETLELTSKVKALFSLVNQHIQNKVFDDIEFASNLQSNILDNIESVRKKQIKRIKAHEAGTKNSLLFLNLIGEMKNMNLYLMQLLKSMKDFVKEHPQNDDTVS